LLSEFNGSDSASVLFYKKLYNFPEHLQRELLRLFQRMLQIICLWHGLRLLRGGGVAAGPERRTPGLAGSLVCGPPQ